MPQRKPYSPTRATKQEFGSDYLKWMAGVKSGTPQGKAEPDYRAVVNSDRRFVEVSDGFCKLVGYTREELLSMRYDDVTAPNTNDIPIVLGQLLRLGYLHGLWMLVSREGTWILVRYHSWLRPDSCIEGHMEVVGAGY